MITRVIVQLKSSAFFIFLQVLLSPMKLVKKISRISLKTQVLTNGCYCNDRRLCLLEHWAPTLWLVQEEASSQRPSEYGKTEQPAFLNEKNFAKLWRDCEKWVECGVSMSYNPGENGVGRYKYKSNCNHSLQIIVRYFVGKYGSFKRVKCWLFPKLALNMFIFVQIRVASKSSDQSQLKTHKNMS